MTLSLTGENSGKHSIDTERHYEASRNRIMGGYFPRRWIPAPFWDAFFGLLSNLIFCGNIQGY